MRTVLIAGGVVFGVMLALVAALVVVTSNGSGAEPAAAVGTPSAEASATPTPARSTATVSPAELARRQQQAQARASAAAEASASAEAAAAAAQAALLDPGAYAPISDRDYDIMLKDPNAHVGEKYLVHGYVTQFDTSMGQAVFRANTAGESHRDWYDYTINTIVTAPDPTILANVVQDDVVKMYVTVGGTYSYTTTLGGTLTVPLLGVNIIEVTGSK